MKVNAHLKDSIIRHFTSKGVTEGIISEFCAMTMTPIVFVCEVLAEEFPEHKEMCDAKAKRVKEFMGAK